MLHRERIEEMSSRGLGIDKIEFQQLCNLALQALDRPFPLSAAEGRGIVTRDELVKWFQSAMRANEHDWTTEADRNRESKRIQEVFDLALQGLDRPAERGADDKLDKILQWCKAYPLSVFPEPDFAKARALLEAGGMTLDAISASNMRHVLQGIEKIIGTPPERTADARDDLVQAYDMGFLDGVRAYAWYKDGRQEVGTTGRTLKDALEGFRKTWNYQPPTLPPAPLKEPGR